MQATTRSVKFFPFAKVVFPVLLLFALLVAAPRSGAQEPLVIKPGWTNSRLNPHLEILVDPEKAFTSAELLAPDQTDKFPWASQIQPSADLGTSSAAFWLRFTVQNDLAQVASLYLQLRFTKLDSIQFYSPGPDGGFTMAISGDAVPFNQRPVRNRLPVFPLQVPAKTCQTYFMRVVSSSKIYIPLQLWNAEAWVNQSLVGYNLAGYYYGAVIVLVLYNLFMFISVRQRAHLYYVFFVTGLGILTMSYFGLAFQFFWPNHPWLNDFGDRFLTNFTVLFCIFFHRSFLDTKHRTPRLDWAIKAGLLLGTVLLVISVTLDFNVIYLINSRWADIANISLILLGLYFYFIRKYSPARFLILGGALLVASFALRSAIMNGLVPARSLTIWGVNFGPWAYALCLSFALADKINLLKRDMALAKDNALEHLRSIDRLKDDILANTSHELLTPLNGIVGLSESLLTDLGRQLNPRQGRALAMIQKSSWRLAHLIGDILDFSRMRQQELELHLEPVDLHLLVDEVVSVCQVLLGGKTLHLHNALPPETPCVLADERRLQQIFFNLVGNAIKFTEEGEVKIHAEQEGGRLRIKVSDTGIGIPEDKCEMIFDSFQQADSSINRQFGGTGLGLSITRQLVELHGSTLSLESQPGKGTTVFFDLTIAEDIGQTRPSVKSQVLMNSGYSQEEVSTFDSSPEFPPGSNLPADARSILVVDDESINLEVLEDFLTREGYQVMAARDGRQALQLFQEIQPDLVILDLMMPKMSGYEVCQKMRETDDPAVLPILILTARRAQDNLAPAFDCGANDFLTKPFNRKDLIARVNSLIKIRELNETKQAKALLECEAEYREQSALHMSSLLESVEKGLIAADKDLMISYMNPQARKMLQFAEEDINGLSVEDLLEDTTISHLGLGMGGSPGNGAVNGRVQHELVSFRKKDGCLITGGMITSVVNHGKDSTLVMIIQPTGAESDSLPAAASQRQLAVQMMCSALVLWEESGHGGKIELASESGLWTVYIHKNSATTRTLDKYLLGATLPNNPRYSQVLKTVNFVLAKCPKPTLARKNLEECLGRWRGIAEKARSFQ